MKDAQCAESNEKPFCNRMKNHVNNERDLFGEGASFGYFPTKDIQTFYPPPRFSSGQIFMKDAECAEIPHLS